jgi:uncharacterized cupin superfamily protein
MNLDELNPQPMPPGIAPPPELAARFECRMAPIAPALGARKLGYNVTVVPPGKRAYPAHNHRVNEEMFLVLAGGGELRIGQDTFALRAGDIVCCPAGGPETAHQIINTGSVELRFLAVSTLQFPEVVEYPDSGKFGVYTGSMVYPLGDQPPFRQIARQAAAVPYWDGE